MAEPKASGSGCLFRSQTTDLTHQIAVVQKTIEQIPAAKKHAIDECHGWLTKANKATADCSFNYAKFDDAWSALHEIRHILCHAAPAPSLERIAEEVASDLVYVTDTVKRKKCETEIRRLQNKLHAALQKTPHNDGALDKLRADLVTLSIIGANERQLQWHRVNLFRGRLQFTAICLTALTFVLLSALVWWPSLLGIKAAELDAYDLSRVVGVLGFGALGGLLSALRQREELAGISSLFYIERMLLFLRPIVGAVAALILYLAQLAKFVTIAPTSSAAVYFVVSFAAGFSEKFFLRHLSALLQGEKKKSVEPGKEKKEQDAA